MRVFLHLFDQSECQFICYDFSIYCGNLHLFDEFQREIFCCSVESIESLAVDIIPVDEEGDC